MALGRMKQWREAQRQRAGGMVEISTWVPVRASKFLKDIFALLGDPSERGDSYRLIVSSWLNRRRVVDAKFHGTSYSAEIDLPYLGPHWHQRPAGGRIFGDCETWVELTPDEAREVSELCQTAVSEILEGWLTKREMIGTLRDHVGVALDPDFANVDYLPRPEDSLFRPETEEEFAKNEAEIAQGVAEAAYNSRRHPRDEPTIVYYPGAFGFPSRCHAIHRVINDEILFALVHVPNGGTSPTNMIVELTRRMHKSYYPDVHFSKIRWFDVYRIPWRSDDEIHINSVEFKKDNESGSTKVIWGRADRLPDDFVGDISRAVHLSSCIQLERSHEEVAGSEANPVDPSDLY